MSPPDVEYKNLILNFSLTLKRLSYAAQANYNSEFAEILCAEASIAMYVMADMQAFAAGYEREYVSRLLLSEIAAEYEDYFMDNYVDYEKISDIIFDHISIYSAAVKQEYTPPCVYSMYRRMPNNTLLSIVLDVLGDYIYFPALSGLPFNPEIPVNMVDDFEAASFYRFYCENVVSEIIEFANKLETIFPLNSQQIKIPKADEASKANLKINNKSSKKEIKPNKKLSGLMLASIIIIAVILIGSIIILIDLSVNADTNNSGINAQKPAVSTVPTSALTPVPIRNGMMLEYTGYECLCPFSVSVSGDDGYYIYLQYQYAPSNSIQERKSINGYNSDVAFYVAPNSTVEIDVPIGVYKLYYAYGPTWYGKTALFGDNTVYCTSSELLEFYADYQYYNGVTLELWPQYNGNFNTTVIDEKSFP